MAAVAPELPVRRREVVAALLAGIEERRRRLYVLRAAGVLPAGMRDLKEELRGLREELALAVSAAGVRAS
jgi:hypothetical protein